jgi:linoleoyl-CoA desaturase
MLLPKYTPKYGSVYKVLDEIQKDYFKNSGKTRFADAKRQFFALSTILSLVASYFAWFFVQNTVLLVLLGIFIGFLVTYLATIMHEVTHQCFSDKKIVNRSILWTLNLLGYNTEFYQKKHSLHHNFTNVEDIDGDLNFSVLMKISPSQKKYFWHKFQWIYNPLLLYPLSGFILIYQINSVLSAKTTSKKILAVLGKLSNVLILIVLPMFFVGFINWILVYAGLMLTAGICLATMNQPVHFFDGTTFDKMNSNEKIEKEWVVQMIKTSTGYQTQNKFINFVTTGVNNHLMHSIFPRVSSRHYPYLVGKIETEIQKQGYDLNNFSSLFTLYISHIKFLKKAAV